MSKIFEVGQAGIENGITLIEASAGTGKTFAIAGMAVRLIAEKGLGISQILIVTFTEAATHELRERVRSRIRQAAAFLEEGRLGEDPALAPFLDAPQDEIQLAVQRLKTALLSFDEATIFTIHGFCQRMLRENAFETGALFDVEVLSDAEPIWRETAEDFWRKSFYDAHPQLGAVVYCLQEAGALSSTLLVELLRKLSRHPDLQILTGTSMAVDQCEREILDTVGLLRTEWLQSAGAIAALLHEAADIFKKDLSPEVIRDVLENLAPLNRDELLQGTAIAAVRKLGTRNILAAKDARKKKPAPQHPFFDLCQKLDDLLDCFVESVRRAFLDAVRGDLSEAKRRHNVVTFDDLLTRLHGSLAAPGGQALATAIGDKFKAALIDEFQDTDPIQWTIFRRIFGSGDHILFLIGDPKQAIYGFRGADIFTYMEARASASRHFTLGTNWRSDKVLVEAANAVFSRHPEAFVFPEIVFEPVAAAAGANGQPAAELDLGQSGLSPQPLQLVCVSGENGEEMNVPEARAKVLAMLVGEINRLLTCGVRRKGRLLEPGEIAVLVRTNRDADEVREKLVQSAIPAVVRTDQSVLQTAEAEHVLRLVAAILEPHKNGLLKAALVSPLFGFTAGALLELDGDEQRWQDLAGEFHSWQETWRRHGFIRMFRELFAAHKVRVRLLGLPDGERLVTNYQHIAECLHAAEYEQTLTPTTLARFLREQHERPEGDAQSYIIRLEKDEKAVQIVTVHRSKGLEYPVVFCPFNWTSLLGGRNRDVIFHDPKNNHRLTWDARSPADPTHRDAYEREQLAEAARLLYVAVTRARSRCYLFWASTGKSENARDCSLAHIMGCSAEKRPKGAPSAVVAAVNELGQSACAGLLEIPDYEGDRRYAVGKVEAASLAARSFAGSLPPGPLITSFSGLTSRAHEVLQDRDSLRGSGGPAARVAEEKPAEPSIFDFPKGARAGNFFHQLLEEIDFARPASLEGAVEKALAEFHFDAKYNPVVTGALKTLLNMRFPPGFKLSDIGLNDRMVEAPFYFPIEPVDAAQLSAAFQTGRLPDSFASGVGRLNFHPVDGYMTGFIDLVLRHDGRYYIIDWKSNWLGATTDDYAGPLLEKAMAESYYYLQYHLYTLALHRHLKGILPGYEYERHFGGVFYIFLRGVDAADPSSGIFHDFPAVDLLDRLERTLLRDVAYEVGPLGPGGYLR